jgi:serine/threonine protein phosphatase PrpC
MPRSGGVLAVGGNLTSGAVVSQQGAMLAVEFAQLSDVGKVRDHNEDYFGYVLPESEDQARTHGWLFALADGVGGHDRGEVASREAVERLLGDFRAARADQLHTALLPRLIQAANTHVFETGHAVNPAGSSMATTIVACGLRYDRAVIAHVGDSRCYLIRRGHCTCLTRDHTFANEQVRLGLLSADEAAGSEHRHMLSRALGSELFVNVESSEHHVITDDVLALCSDGLHASIRPSDFTSVVTSGSDLAAAAQNLVELANERDGSDNISVQLIRVKGVERVGMYRGRPYRLR